jgi:hypothetical protein
MSYETDHICWIDDTACEDCGIDPLLATPGWGAWFEIRNGEMGSVGYCEVCNWERHYPGKKMREASALVWRDHYSRDHG